MTIAPGARLGPYEVLAPLGVGGMGEVYRARDARLGREVALKVVQPRFAADAEQLRRFEQEARAAAALNHPNIIALFDVGRHEAAPFVVTELLAGESLREKLGSPLPPKKGVEYAIQIAQGLSAAHEKGIVHRDLKPENLFVTKDGRIKILDFGIAKLTQPAIPSISQTEALTAAPDTEPGIVMGTVGYMSPEQVQGKPLDARSDLFSLGVILYEMLSGKHPFQKQTAVETMHAILKEEPPELSETNKAVSPGLERIVRHCLEKEPSSRFQSARDFAFDLEQLTSISGPSAAVVALPRERRGGRLRPLLAGAAIPSVIALALGFLLLHRMARSEPPLFQRLTWRRGTVESARFAPDGQTVLYSASWDGKPPAVYIKRPESPDAVPLDLPSARLLGISPSGEMAVQLDPQEAHFWITRGTLARVALTGGTPREIAENVNQADWGSDGGLLVARDVAGKGRLEYPLGKILYETAGYVSYPRLSPKGELIAFIDHPVAGDDRGSIAVVDLHGKKRTLSKEFESVQGLAWSPSGKEIWFAAAEVPRDRPLWAVTLEGRQRMLARVPGDVRLQDITRSGRVLLTLGDFRMGIKWLPPGESRERDVCWFGLSNMRGFSRDGKAIAFIEQGEPAGPSYAACLQRSDGSPIRLGEGPGVGPLSPDGRWVWSARSNKPLAPWVLLPTGVGEPKVLDVSRFSDIQALAWFPDGKHFLVAARTGTQAVTRIYDLGLNGEEPRPMTPEGVTGPLAISLDARFVAALAHDRKIGLYPVDGGDPRPAPGAVEGDIPVQWSGDGSSLYVVERRQRPSIPIRVFRVDLKTDKRELWKELFPEDPAGITGAGGIRMTPDGSSYAYNYTRALSDLYMIEGLK